MAEVHLKGKPSNSWYRQRHHQLSREVRWLRREVARLEREFDFIARALCEGATRIDDIVIHLPAVSSDVVIVRSERDASGKTDAFTARAST